MFLEKLLYLRLHGVDVPVVYVAYPPLLGRMQDDIEFFAEHDFIVHVRRYEGVYNGKYYPKGYTDNERRFIAGYMDTGSIKYMLNMKPLLNRRVFSGYDFFIVSCTGDIGFDSDCWERYTGARGVFGNVIEYNYVKLPLHPLYYPVGHTQGTVDGVSNILEADYEQLKDNNIIDYMAQGHVYKTDNGVHYGHINTDFTDRSIRARYYFPARDIKDKYHHLKHVFHSGLTRHIKAWINRIRGLSYHYKRQGRSLRDILLYLRGRVVEVVR